MFDEHYPTDEILRLILAADQEEWLGERLNESKMFIWAMAILLAISAAWGSLNFKDAFTYFDEPKCFSLQGNAADNEAIRKELVALGLKPCPPEGSAEDLAAKEITWRDVRAMATFASWLVVVASFVTLLRHLYQYRKFKGYLADHRAFLAKYNRL